jgi:hypothetical protein
MPFGGGKMPTPREWVRICELEKAAVEHHQSVEKWIEIDRKLDPNWTEEKSKASGVRCSLLATLLCVDTGSRSAALRLARASSGLSSKLERELPVVLKAFYAR